MPSLLNYKRIKSLPDGIKKRIVEDAVNRVMERHERSKETINPPEESPGDESDTIAETYDLLNPGPVVPDELMNPKEHGGDTEVLVKRLRESREEY